MGKRYVVLFTVLIVSFQIFFGFAYADIGNRVSLNDVKRGDFQVKRVGVFSSDDDSGDSDKDSSDRIRIQKSTIDKTQEYLKYFGDSKRYNSDYFFELDSDFVAVHDNTIVEYAQDQEDVFAADLSDIFPITKRSLSSVPSFDYDLDQQGCDDVSSNYTQPYKIDASTTNVHKPLDLNYVRSCVRPALTNNVSSIKTKQLTIDEFTTRNVLELYCLSMYNKSDVGRIYFEGTNTWAGKQTFDPHKSLFLYALCSTFKDKSGNTPFYNGNSTVSEAFKGDIKQILGLKQMSKGKDNCSLSDDITIEDCDMAIYATKIYSGIMSELYKIKFSQVLEVDTVEGFNVQRKVEDFFRGYYLIYDPYVLLKRRYPRAVGELEKNQMWHKQNHLDTLKLIDNSKLRGLANGCSLDGGSNGMKFVGCALHSSHANGFSLTPSFVTLLYNELLTYRQFVTFYQKWLDLKVEAMGRDTTSEKKVRIYQARSTDFKRYFDMQMEGTNWTQRWFEEFNLSYPLHICVVLEQEGGRCLIRNP